MLCLKTLSLVLFTWLLLLPSSCAYSWTASEWLGGVEATAGAAVLKAPEVTPSTGECENCGGTGRLGDGTISVECPVCDGTGKSKTQGVLQACRSCGIPAKIDSNPTQPGMEAPTSPQDATKGGGGYYGRRLFRRR